MVGWDVYGECECGGGGWKGGVRTARSWRVGTIIVSL